MAELMKNQFGLKMKNSYSYRHPYPEWYNRVIMTSGVRLPEFSKFTGQDDVTTVEHISRYLAQLGEASAEEPLRVQCFPMSLSGPAFTWWTSLPPGSIERWSDLERKFHSYFFTGTNEKTLVDLTNLKQRFNESAIDFLKRFRETRNLCFSLNIPDDQLPGLAIAGMLPVVREKLLGQQFDDLGQLGQRLGLMSNQFQHMRREPRFQKDNAFTDAYRQFLAEPGADEEEEEQDYDEMVAFTLPMDWSKKKSLEVPDFWKGEKGQDRYDFNVSKTDFLLHW